MAMVKFSTLLLGSEFGLEGERYVKAGALTATHTNSGRQRFVARYVMVSLGEEESEDTKATEEADILISGEALREALEVCRGRCDQAVAEAGLDSATASALMGKLHHAQDECLAKILGKEP